MRKGLLVASIILLGGCSASIEGLELGTQSASSATMPSPESATPAEPTAEPTAAPTPTTPPVATTPPEPTPTPTPTPTPEPLPSEQEAVWRPRADALISFFENSTTEIQYGYAKALGDGRGITAGRAGFTSGTGDLVLVVERVVDADPSNPLAAFLPELQELAQAWSADVSGLAGFEEAWEAQESNGTLRAAQDAVVDELYFLPSQAIGDELGAELPLTRAALYGTAVQHGLGEDPDGLPALVLEATTVVGGSPVAGVDETVWLRAFLAVRKAHLENAFEPATRVVWAQSAGRVDTWALLLDQGVTLLDQSFMAEAFGSTFMVD